MSYSWHWWFGSDAGLVARIAIGCAIFAGLLVVDLVRRGRNATRWREYLFLLGAVTVAMAYGFGNDFIAASISWEYFYYGKGLSDRLGPGVPPQMAALRLEACKIGLKATWSAGLIVGVVLLLANNPRRHRRQLPYRYLLRLLGLIALCTATGGLIGAWLGSHGWLAWTNPELQLIVRDDLFRPRQFLCVYGMNLGGYAGGALGAIIAVARIVRRRLPSRNSPLHIRIPS